MTPPDSRPYSPYPSSRKPAYSRNVADVAPDTGATETIVIEDYDAYDDQHDLDSYDDFDYDDDDGYDPIDRRWIWVGGVAAAILLVAIICTVVILGGGDSGSVSATVSPPAVTTTQAPRASTTPPPAPPPPPAPLPSAGPLAPETVTTVAPTPTAADTPAPTAAAPSPRTITYQVTGSRQLLDLVTVIYTDQQGALQTDVNVALPWNKTVVLDPGVELTSVTATSLMGKLNCSITDASGQLINAQTTNSMIATCTK